MRKKGGFTLLEIMLSLMIVGLIASVAGSAIVAGINGYLAAKENQSLAQKSQLAMLRLSRDLQEFVNIPTPGVNAGANSIIIDLLLPVNDTDVRMRRLAIGLDGSYLKVNEDDPGTTPDFRNGDVLVDGVSSFTLTYFRDGAPWQPASDSLQRLATIQIALVLVRPDGLTRSFVTQVHPRNINSLGGQPTPVTPPDAESYSKCFVATAAYGRADHPVVLFLREFRDRYLKTWNGGKALVEAYYVVGPALASLIQGRPWACVLAQVVLLPFVVFAVFALYFPLGIPIVLFALWVLFRKSRANGYFRKGVPAMLRDQRGAVLVAVVITMLVFATLGAMMLSFFTTSTFSQLGGSRGMRAFYLAESGFRYAASRYLNAPSIYADLASPAGCDATETCPCNTDECKRQRALEDLHNRTFTLTSEGQFLLQVYPYWYETTARPAGTNLQAKVFGGLPLASSQYANGSWVLVRYGQDKIRYEQIASVTLSQPSSITFVKTSAWSESYPVGSMIYPVALGVNSSQTLNVNQAGNFISLQQDSGYGAFLTRNGVFTVKEQGADTVRTLSYDELYVDAGSGTYQLRGIRDNNTTAVSSVTIPAGSQIVLGKCLRLQSTGLLTAGTTTETKRRVTYLLPIGYVSGGGNPKSEWKQDFQDNATFQNPATSHWFTGEHTSHIGTQEIVANVDGGGSALHIQTVDNRGSQDSCTFGCGGICPYVMENTLGFNWSNAGVRFDQEWQRAGYFLSYDVQTKMYIGYSNDNYEQYANGLLFRLDREANSYGLSFTCYGYIGDDCDGMPDAVASSGLRYTPVLTLWRKQYPTRESFGPGQVPESPHATYSDAPNYCTTSPADTQFVPDIPAKDTRAIITSIFFANGDRVRFQTTGTLPAPLVSGEDYYVRRVVKNGVYYLYLFDTATHAQKVWQGCYGSPLDCTCWTGLIQVTSAGTGTHTIIAQKPVWTRLAGASSRLEWASGSDQRDYLHLTKRSWDSSMRKWITVLVRLKEAPSVSFNQGGGTAHRRITFGDTVYQTTDGAPGSTITAIAKVGREPAYRYTTNRNWGDGTAEGALILDVVKDTGGSVKSYAFSTGNLLVGEPPGGVVLANVTEFRPKDNWIQVFVADPDDPALNPRLKAPSRELAIPAPEITAYDQRMLPTNEIYRLAVTRGQVYWPPDNTVDGEGKSTIQSNIDYFTLVRMNVSDAASVTGFYSENINSYDIFRIRETSAPFLTPDSGSFPTDRPEVGIHTYGSMSTYTYFDDFAIQFGESARKAQSGFLQPIQY